MSTFYDRALPEGESGYFSQPSQTLDPSLFDGMHLRPEVRQTLLLDLASGLVKYLNLAGANDWLRAWLAGSGITYQWSADRGNGDLDVLFGVDMAEFVRYNPDYQGVPEASVADHTDQVLRQKMWPTTAHTQFGQQEYEVTFYWAAGIGQGIEIIHPYAAYDLKRDAWVVLPPDDPRAPYPSEWFEAARRDSSAAELIARRHANLTAKLASTGEDEARRVNYTAQLGVVQSAAMSLFDEIHGGRAAAFGEQGRGYGDFANFRWQHAKLTGAIAGLKDILRAAKSTQATSDAKLYGGPISGAEQILTRDMLRRGQ